MFANTSGKARERIRKPTFSDCGQTSTYQFGICRIPKAIRFRRFSLRVRRRKSIFVKHGLEPNSRIGPVSIPGTGMHDTATG